MQYYILLERKKHAKLYTFLLYIYNLLVVIFKLTQRILEYNLGMENNDEHMKFDLYILHIQKTSEFYIGSMNESILNLLPDF